MVEANIQQYLFECKERKIVDPIKWPQCCYMGCLQADNPVCVQCEKNMLDKVSDQFQICREMNQLLGYKASGFTPAETQRIADVLEQLGIDVTDILGKENT